MVSCNFHHFILFAPFAAFINTKLLAIFVIIKVLADVSLCGVFLISPYPNMPYVIKSYLVKLVAYGLFFFEKKLKARYLSFICPKKCTFVGFNMAIRRLAQQLLAYDSP